MPKRPINVLIIILALFVAGCGVNVPAAATLEPVEYPTVAPATDIPVPTEIPPANRVLLATGSQLAEADTQTISVMAQSLSEQSGLIFESIPALTPEALTPDVKIVIALPPDPGIADLASRFPDIRFISVGISAIQPSNNLFAVGNEGAHPEWVGFTAGYVAAILTNEWRVGALTQAGSNEGLLAGDAFRNGAMFFCGLCNPTFPPFTDYPIYVDMPIAASQPEWQQIADAFIISGVKTAYIYPTVADSNLMIYLAQGGMRLIGGETPPDALRPAWIATIQMDYSNGLQKVWGDAVSGLPGRTVPTGISLTDVDTNALTEGKMRLVYEVIAALMAGGISPNTVQ